MSIKENRRGRHFLFGYFFFVAGDKEKVTIQPQMLWFNDWPIKQQKQRQGKISQGNPPPAPLPVDFMKNS